MPETHAVPSRRSRVLRRLIPYGSCARAAIATMTTRPAGGEEVGRG